MKIYRPYIDIGDYRGEHNTIKYHYWSKKELACKELNDRLSNLEKNSLYPVIIMSFGIEKIRVKEK